QVENHIPAAGAGRTYPGRCSVRPPVFIVRRRLRNAGAKLDSPRRTGGIVGCSDHDAGHRLGLSEGGAQAHGLNGLRVIFRPAGSRRLIEGAVMRNWHGIFTGAFAACVIMAVVPAEGSAQDASATEEQV